MLQSDDQPNSPATAGPLFHGARGLAVKVLTRIEQSDAYLDKLLENELASGDLNDADKRLLNELATGVLRWQARLDWVLTGFYHGEFSKCIPVVRNALRVALYQILYLDRIPNSAAVNESVEIVKRLKGERSARIVNGVLRSIIRRINAITYPERTEDVARYLSIMYSHPLWLSRRWVAQLGEEQTQALMEANNRRPRIALRVNRMRTTTEELLSAFRERGINAAPSAFAEGVIVADTFPGIGRDPLFQAGMYTVQDEGAVLATRLAAVRPGMRVIDLCAAPGGKATAMAEDMNGTGEVIAVDKYEAKLRTVAAAAARLGLGDAIHPIVGDARSLALEPADVVLIDAPCSGLGVLAKKPDIKWKREPEDIEAMVPLQRALLENGAQLVKPGGALIYSTCTIERSENQEMVESFLKDHPEFRLEPAAALLPAAVAGNGYLETFPHRHGMDGMFAARLVRREHE
ncbi:MAG TPA: 16S rRNA (cytosine(967)-C(5))-methyltransferase RsmB [Candidatus Kapabacteria bacterium]|nr:16S rRNA (cytosine(967)-C(5))-methyltransferase RsmB [Candidatus Kapabacteria bacterium]